MDDLIRSMKKEIIEISYKKQEGHIASAFSVLNILNVLYGKLLDINPHRADDINRDIFIMSKGHASIGLYVILKTYGFISKEELYTFGDFGSALGGHPDRNKINGVEASTGSLGHGLPIAVGIALGYKIQKVKNKVYVLVGDGELNEGSMWEAILLAGNHNLNNLTCIIDYNHSNDRAIKLQDLEQKFASFNWITKKVDGHDELKLESLLREKAENPRAIIAETIKGYGCKRMENNPEWHHKSPNETEFCQIMEELQ